MNKSSILVLSWILCALISVYNIQAQEILNINEPKKPVIYQQNTLKIADYKDAERYRELSFNPRIRSLSNQNKKDTLYLDLFNDKKYKAVIEDVSNNPVTKTTNTRAKIVGFQGAYCYLSSDAKSSYIMVDIPSNDEYFFITFKNNKYYISEYKASKLKEGMPTNKCGSPDLPSVKTTDKKTESKETLKNISANVGYEGYRSVSCPQPAEKGIDDDATIDLLIVYTPAFAEWCEKTSLVTSLDHAISSIMTKLDIPYTNSKTGVKFRLVHYQQIDYKETNTEQDLHNLSGAKDGYMDDVHEIRAKYNADLVMLIANINFVGGLASLKNFVLVSTSMAIFDWAVPHELGHELGAGHNWQQLDSPGPLFKPYSSGWKGFDSSNKPICTIMTYGNAQYHPENITYGTIPYFSSPDIQYKGVTIGSVENEDNTRVIKENKHKVASSMNLPVTIDIPNYQKNIGEADPKFTYILPQTQIDPGDTIILTRKAGETKGLYEINAQILRNNVDVTCQYGIFIKGGFLRIGGNEGIIQPTITADKNDKFYTDGPIIPDIKVIPEGTPYTITYQGVTNSNDYYYFTTQAPSETGEYTYNVQVDPTETTAGVSYNGTMKILKATSSIEVQPKTVEYTGKPIPMTDFQILLSGVPLDLTLEKNKHVAVIDYTGIEGTNYPTSENPPKEIGKYQVDIYADGGINYSFSAASTTLTITGSTKPTPVITIENRTETYDGTPKQVTATANVHGDKISYLYYGMQNDGTFYGPINTPPTNAGSYNVTSSIPETPDYQAVSCNNRVDY